MVGSGVAASIHWVHLMAARLVTAVAFAADGSTVLLHAGGGGPPYSSASSAKLCPISWRVISAEAAFIEATATDATGSAVGGVVDQDHDDVALVGLSADRDRTSLTLVTFTQIRR